MKAVPFEKDVVATSFSSRDGAAGTLRGRFSSLIDGRLGLELELPAAGKSIWPYTKDRSARAQSQMTTFAVPTAYQDLLESSLDVEIWPKPLFNTD